MLGVSFSAKTYNGMQPPAAAVQHHVALRVKDQGLSRYVLLITDCSLRSNLENLVPGGGLVRGTAPKKRCFQSGKAAEDEMVKDRHCGAATALPSRSFISLCQRVSFREVW